MTDGTDRKNIGCFIRIAGIRLIPVFGILCLTSLPAEISAAPAAKLPGLENGMLKIQNVPAAQQNDKPDQKAGPEIRDDRRNVQITRKEDAVNDPKSKTSGRASSWSATTPVPPRSLAAKLLDPRSGIVLHWSPRERVGLLRGVRIPAAALSPDQSVLALVETTGGDEPPNGSRIVLINTHTWEILKLIEIPRLTEKIVFAWTEPAVFVLCKPQPELKQSGGLARILLDSDVPEDSFIPTGSVVFSDLLCDRVDRVYLSDAAKPRVLVFRPGSTYPRTVEVLSPGSALALSPDGRRWAAAGISGKIEIFKTGDCSPLSTEAIPQDFPIRQLLFLDNANNFLCAPDPLKNRAAFAVRVGRIREFEGFSAGALTVSTDGNTILHRKQASGEIEFLDSRSFRKLASAVPERISPRTHGVPREVYLLEAGELTAVLDDAGNLYVLHRPEKETKFQKKIILTPWK